MSIYVRCFRKWYVSVGFWILARLLTTILDPRSWFQDPGSSILFIESRILNSGSRALHPGSRTLDLDSGSLIYWVLDPVLRNLLPSWIQYYGTCFLDPGPWFLDSGSRTLATGSWIQDPGSSVLDLGSAWYHALFHWTLRFVFPIDAPKRMHLIHVLCVCWPLCWNWYLWWGRHESQWPLDRWGCELVPACSPGLFSFAFPRIARQAWQQDGSGTHCW